MYFNFFLIIVFTNVAKIEILVGKLPSEITHVIKSRRDLKSFKGIFRYKRYVVVV